MAFLERFSEEERNLLVSLPYRAGVWISAMDRSGGAVSSKAELDALEKIIRQKAKGMLESAFVHEVMNEACAHKSDWPQWAEKTQSVLADSKSAIEVIGKKLPAHDLDAYRQNVMYIAVEVAKAFREFDVHTPLLSHVWDSFRNFLDRFVGVAQGGTHETANLSNISYEEDVALAGLSKALGIDNGEEEDKHE